MIRTGKLRKVFFFTHPSFVRGVGRIVDPFGQLSRQDIKARYSSGADPDKVAYQALRSDWEVVGRDLYSAIREYGRELSRKRYGRR